MDISLETEKQKSCRSRQITGETYNSLDPDLDTEHRKTRELLRRDEMHIGTGHGILFQPLEAWIAPTIQWEGN